MHIAPLYVLLTAFAAPEIWIADSATRVFPDSAPPSDVTHAVHLALAAGESESFQIAVRAGDHAIERLAIEFVPDAVSPIQGPDICEVGYVRAASPSDRAVGRAAVWPDPLHPYEAKPLAPHRLRVFWLTYSARGDAPAGDYEREVTVRMGEGDLRTFDVHLEVFGFSLPEVPSLPALFTLERAPIRNAYGFGDDELLRWQSVYDALADSRLSYRVWEEISASDLEDYTAHLAYAVNVNRMRVLYLGAIGAVDTVDPILPELSRWLARRDLSERAAIGVGDTGARASWDTQRKRLAAVGQRAPEVRRLIATPFHPYWEESAEIWAAPYDDYNPNAVQLLRSGRSLAWAQTAPPSAVEASSFDEPTRPADAFDGSLFSHWSPVAEDDEARFQATLEHPLTLDSFLVAFNAGAGPSSIRFATSRDGVAFTPATVSWSVDRAHDPFEYEWWSGTLRFSKTFAAFRFEIEGPAFELAEVSFESRPDYPALPDGHTIATWFSFKGASYPSFEIDAPVLDYRVAPWLCWAQDVSGFTGGSLTDWPLQLYIGARSLPELWPPARVGDCMLYPGPSGPLPSIRLMQLRDGMEDYEYLLALKRALAASDTEIDSAWLRPLAVATPDFVERARRESGTALEDVLQRRVTIGRALTDIAAGRAPRNPRGFAR